MSETEAGLDGTTAEVDLDLLHKRRVVEAFDRLQVKAGFTTKRDFLKAINANLGTATAESTFSRWTNGEIGEDHPRAIILLAAFELAGLGVPRPTREEARMAALERRVRELEDQNRRPG